MGCKNTLNQISKYKSGQWTVINCDSDPQFNHNPINKDPICVVKNTKTEFSLKYKSGQPQKTKKQQKKTKFSRTMRGWGGELL